MRFFYTVLYFISRPLTDIVKTTRIDPNLFVFFAKNADQDMVGSTWEVYNNLFTNMKRNQIFVIMEPKY